MTRPDLGTIAALYVEKHGCYADLPGVELWDEARDARLYGGPWPVVAHPPCTRWCRLAGLVEARWGYKRGDDGGCFAAALGSVREFGGVLEHPAHSGAWGAHELNGPPTGGAWVNADLMGGWTCYVEQGRYGHRARKGTWLYANGAELPSLKWGFTSGTSCGVSWTGRSQDMLTADPRPRLASGETAATPHEFRNILLAMARSVSQRSTT